MDGTPHGSWIELKDALARFARDALHRPHDERERQCGELLLELLKVADRMNVDLFEAGAQLIGERASQIPRLVRATGPGKAEG
ncbi:MAG: hypothetical protein IT480_02925 [Gammaproteobacteria bacterium]|nr:hypothetical protein [Gammaproteobacteria bacterium]